MAKPTFLYTHMYYFNTHAHTLSQKHLLKVFAIGSSLFLCVWIVYDDESVMSVYVMWDNECAMNMQWTYMICVWWWMCDEWVYHIFAYTYHIIHMHIPYS